MKVFVTGADGMLGTNIVHELLDRKYEVKCLVHPKSLSKTLDGLQIEKLSGNILEPNTFESHLTGCDFVIHVAASTAVWPGRNEMVNRINLEGTRNVMMAAKKANIKRFIHVGSANTFAPGTKEKPGNELNPYEGWKYKNDYMDSKYKCHQMLLNAFKTEAFPVIIVAPTYMIGPFDSGPTSGRLLLSLVEGKVPAYSIGVKSFVHTRDVAIAMVNALTMGRLGEAYIAGGENLSLGDFFKKASKVAEIKFKLIRIPYVFVLITGLVGSIFARITGKAPSLSFGMARMSGMLQYYSSQKAISELSMPQTPVEQAIADCLKWFRDNNIKL